MRQGSPKAYVRHAYSAARIAQNPYHPRGPLIPGRENIKLSHQLVVRCKARQRNRTSVKDLIEVRAQGDDPLYPAFPHQSEDSFTEGPPAQLGLGPNPEDKIPFRTNPRAIVEIIGWPMDFPLHPLGETNHWTLYGKVVEILRIDARKFGSDELFCQVTNCSGR